MLTEAEKSELLSIAKKSIESYVKKSEIPDFQIKSPTFQKPSGAFVSLHKGGALRGCIGYIEPAKPLWITVRDAAIAAATQDYRFEPVGKSELNKIEIEISVLSPLTLIKSPDEIEVGKHGLLISQYSVSGLLLPQVATQYGWDKSQFLSQTCLKAGLPENAWKEGATIYAFTADVFH